LIKEDSGLLPNDFDAQAIVEKQKSALESFPAGLVRKHIAQLGLSGTISASDLVLHSLVMDLYRRLDALTGPADMRRSDPLSYYEKNVSPVLQLLQQQRSLNSMRAPVTIDFGADFMGYNWHQPEVAHGLSTWRWMGPGPESGIMIPAVADVRVLRVIGRPSVVAQDSELKIRLNGNPLKIISDRKQGGNLHITLEVPEGITTETQMSTFPWCVLQFAVQTHTQPNETDPRSLGYGIGQLELLGDKHE
jgi:hypothetical protein